MLGSHLDSVPNGSRFDGALGVMAALEVLKTLKESRIPLKVNVEAIDFTDEEGTLVGLLGKPLVGLLDPGEPVDRDHGRAERRAEDRCLLAEDADADALG